MTVQNWLDKVTPNTIRNGRFPLVDILRDSLFYPASGFDFRPIKYLEGCVCSFVYVDIGWFGDVHPGNTSEQT